MSAILIDEESQRGENRMSGRYRLVWFQHLSKAAGTSIVRLAEANGEIFYPHHSNGHPRNSDGTLVRLWEMDTAALTAFIDHCQQSGVTFVVTEWAAPDFRVLASDPRVRLVTCLRDPLKRFISNYYFAFYSGRSDCKSLSDYENSEESIWGIYTRSNYYCRIFSRHHDSPEPVGQVHFDQARENLALFDCRLLLEDRNPFAALETALGWSIENLHANPTRLGIWSMLKLLLRGKFSLVRRWYIHPRRHPDEAFVSGFRQRNRWDDELIRWIAGEGTSVEERHSGTHLTPEVVENE